MWSILIFINGLFVRFYVCVCVVVIVVIIWPWFLYLAPTFDFVWKKGTRRAGATMATTAQRFGINPRYNNFFFLPLFTSLSLSLSLSFSFFSFSLIFSHFLSFSLFLFRPHSLPFTASPSSTEFYTEIHKVDICCFSISLCLSEYLYINLSRFMENSFRSMLIIAVISRTTASSWCKCLLFIIINNRTAYYSKPFLK